MLKKKPTCSDVENIYTDIYIAPQIMICDNHIQLVIRIVKNITGSKISWGNAERYNSKLKLDEGITQVLS